MSRRHLRAVRNSRRRRQRQSWWALSLFSILMLFMAAVMLLSSKTEEPQVTAKSEISDTIYASGTIVEQNDGVTWIQQNPDEDRKLVTGKLGTIGDQASVFHLFEGDRRIGFFAEVLDHETGEWTIYQQNPTTKQWHEPGSTLRRPNKAKVS